MAGGIVGHVTVKVVCCSGPQSVSLDPYRGVYFNELSFVSERAVVNVSS